MSNPANDIRFTGTVRNPRPHTDGTHVTLQHPELSLTFVLPHGTDPTLTQDGARITVVADEHTGHAHTVTAA